MKIVCPSCEATYEVPEAVVGARRPMRCARCGTNWVPGASEDAPAAQTAVPDPVEAPAPDPVAATPVEVPLAVLVPTDDPEPAPASSVSWPESAQTPAVETAPPTPDPPRPEPAKKLQPELMRPRPATPLRAEQLGRDGKPLGVLPPKPRAPVAAWVASLVLLLCLAGAAMTFRTPFMKAWPPSTRLYAALGLYHP